MDEKSRILAVDDDRALLDMTEEMISNRYDVSLATSGAQALELLRRGGAPDLILLDIDMPDMDGYETLSQIREILPLAETPVIFLTGIATSEAELTGLKLGAQDYIRKPFVRENLLARIELRLENGRQARRLTEMSKTLRNAGTNEELLRALANGLTPSEYDVTRLIAQGCGNQEIADLLNYSPGYVKNLASIVYDKFKVRGRSELRALLRK